MILDSELVMINIILFKLYVLTMAIKSTIAVNLRSELKNANDK